MFAADPFSAVRWDLRGSNLFSQNMLTPVELDKNLRKLEVRSERPFEVT